MSNELHVPTMGRIRDDYIEAWAGHFMDGEKGAAEYFDQALTTHNATIEAAAEQRGAERVLREVADHMHENTSVIIDGDKYTACSSCTSIYRQYLDYRADQIANKEEDE